MVTEKKARTKMFKKGDFATLEEHRVKLKMEGTDFSEALGYTRSAFGHWRKTGVCPLTAVIAGEALVRRAGGRVAVPNSQTLLAAKLNQSQWATLEPLFKALQVDYLTV